MINHSIHKHITSTLVLSLTTLTALSGAILASPKASADTSANVNISVTVPSVCSLTANPDTLTATIYPGHGDTVGTTNIKAVCNDPAGLAVYAIGYTNDTYGNTNLTATVGASSIDISTNVTPSGTPSTSEWNMTLTAVSGDYIPTIATNFDSAHEIPSVYTKVAYRNSMTDMGTNATGANFTADFYAYIAENQAAGTYTGKVKFTLVHPAIHNAPASHPATLDTGQTVNAKIKSLAAGSSKNWYDIDTTITAIEVHTEIDNIPSGFTPSDANTISSSTSAYPIYIIIDNGTVHFYTEGIGIALPVDSSYMFDNMQALVDLSDLSDWDASNVEYMECMFANVGYSTTATTFSLDLSNWDTSSVTSMDCMFNSIGYTATTFSLDVSGWDTSSVTEMDNMFEYVGYSATTWSIIGLSDWDTSNVTDMGSMFSFAGCSVDTFSLPDISNWDTSSVEYMGYTFSGAGYNATTFSLDLSGWETPSVTSMSLMFNSAGYNATTFSLDLSDFDASSVENMDDMFSFAGYSATAANWSVTIPQTNGDSINNTTSRMYGQTTSIYGEPFSGKSFTLAQ